MLPVALPDTAQASVFVFFRFLVLCFFGHFSDGTCGYALFGHFGDGTCAYNGACGIRLGHFSDGTCGYALFCHLSFCYTGILSCFRWRCLTRHRLLSLCSFVSLCCPIWSRVVLVFLLCFSSFSRVVLWLPMLGGTRQRPSGGDRKRGKPHGHMSIMSTVVASSTTRGTNSTCPAAPTRRPTVPPGHTLHARHQRAPPLTRDTLGGTEPWTEPCEMFHVIFILHSFSQGDTSWATAYYEKETDNYHFFLTFTFQIT